MSKNTCLKGHYDGAPHMLTAGTCIRCGWEDPTIKALAPPSSPSFTLFHPVDAEQKKTLKKIADVLQEMTIVLKEMNDRLVRVEDDLAARKRLPKGMEHCTILFEECPRGHGFLRAANWVQQRCPWCTIEDLRDASHR